MIICLRDKWLPQQPPPYNMSQIDFHAIIRQQQEQLAAMQAQIQALLAGGAGEQEGR